MTFEKRASLGEGHQARFDPRHPIADQVKSRAAVVEVVGSVADHFIDAAREKPIERLRASREQDMCLGRLRSARAGTVSCILLKDSYLVEMMGNRTCSEQSGDAASDHDRLFIQDAATSADLCTGNSIPVVVPSPGFESTHIR